jgi:hypothetical protein
VVFASNERGHTTGNPQTGTLKQGGGYLRVQFYRGGQDGFRALLIYLYEFIPILSSDFLKKFILSASPPQKLP